MGDPHSDFNTLWPTERGDASPGLVVGTPVRSCSETQLRGQAGQDPHPPKPRTREGSRNLVLPSPGDPEDPFI